MKPFVTQKTNIITLGKVMEKDDRKGLLTISQFWLYRALNCTRAGNHCLLHLNKATDAFA